MNLYEQLLKEDKIKLYAEECFNKIRNEEKVIIFGVGKGGINTYKFLTENNYKGKITCFCDNDSSNWYNDIDGIEVISPEKMISKYTNEKIIITCSSIKQVTKQLNELGISNEQILMFDFIYLDWSNTAFDFVARNMEYLEEAYSLMGDNKSKEVFSGVLNYKMSKDIQYLNNISDEEAERAFDKSIINFKGNQVFIDGGSYTGDTLKQFIELSNNQYNKCFCFEVKKRNYDLLIETININNFRNVEAKFVGLWNEKNNLKFKKVGSGSGSIDENGKEIVEVDTIDNVLCGERADFIKLDIEGSEKNAILGAVGTIKKYKPILSISIYSRIEYFFEIPILINSICPDYIIYFRHYNKKTDFSTVCYAVPKNIIK